MRPKALLFRLLVLPRRGVLLALICGCGVMISANAPAADDEQSVPFWERGASWLIDYRNQLSTDIDQMARAIDHFFAGEAALEAENKTFARLRTAFRWQEASGLEIDPELKFRLSLPATQNRYRLIIESDDSNIGNIDSSNQKTDVDGSISDTKRISAALQLLNGGFGDWKTKARIGVRGGRGLNPFIRHSARLNWDIDDNWFGRFEQRIGYYRVEGVKADHTLIFERRMEQNVLYRSKTQWGWRESEDTLELGQIFTLYNRISDSRGIEYQLGFIGGSSHHTVLERSYFSIDHRQLLYKDWLFLDIIPELEFERETDFDPVASLTFRLEVLFFQ